VIAGKFKFAGHKKDIGQYKKDIADEFISVIFNTFNDKESFRHQELYSKKHGVKLAVNEVKGEWYGVLIANFSDALGKK
jgi:hypothetical protein